MIRYLLGYSITDVMVMLIGAGCVGIDLEANPSAGPAMTRDGVEHISDMMSMGATMTCGASYDHYKR